MRCLLGLCGKNAGGSWFGVVLVGVVLALLGVKLAQLRPAETPQALASEGVTLKTAMERASIENKPVLAFATASWCGPCQSFKRGGLADPEVQALIESRTIALTLEVTTPEGEAGISQLPVEAFPTLLLIENGAVTSSISGNQSAERVRSWLELNTLSE